MPGGHISGNIACSFLLCRAAIVRMLSLALSPSAMISLNGNSADAVKEGRVTGIVTFTLEVWCDAATIQPAVLGVEI